MQHIANPTLLSKFPARRTTWKSASIAVLLLAAAGCPTPTSAPEDPDDAMCAATPSSWTEGQSLTVWTESGPVSGRVQKNIASFLGIPYAAPPVGALRFRPPTAAASWSALRDATKFGPACPQSGDSSSSEDCLTVNVWTPAIGTCAPLPVMVFIHGGGFSSGSSSDPLYDGQKLAARGPAVLVSLNYRLGALGSLAHPALDAEDSVHHVSGNQGLLDQQLALRWVQANIAAFGGDPRRVTAFGESAGAISLCAQMASPLAPGLFRAAIGESGPCTFLSTPIRDVPGSMRESAETLGQRFAVGLGCDTDTDPLACMRSKSVSAVLSAIPNPPLVNRTGAGWGPIIDGYVLPRTPWQAIQAGSLQHVPYITGVNRDEGSLFVGNTAVGNENEYQAAIAALVPQHVDAALALYPAASYANPRAAYVAFLTDVLFVCPARAQARAMAAIEPRTYLYSFTRQNVAGSLSGLGVFHGSELPYVFDNFAFPFVALGSDQTLAGAMGDHWTRFASRLDPNLDSAVAWPQYTEAIDAYLELGDKIQVGEALHASACATVETWVDAP